MPNLIKPLLLTTSCITLFASLSPLQAQNAQADNETALGEIIVTAQRRAENLQQVPISVATLGGEGLTALTSSGQDIRTLSARVPSLVVESSFGRTFPRFYIRGLGNTDFDLNASQPVSLVYDDIVLENPILKGFPVFDIARVEVLRGPQGTLFGRNTPAGIVKFDSQKPTDTLEGYARVNYGRFNAVNFEGALGGPLGEKVAARASFLYQRRDDFIDNLRIAGGDDLEGYEEVAGRVQFLLKPTENLNITLTGQYRNLDGTARVFFANAIQPGTNNLVSTPNNLAPNATNVAFGPFNRFQVQQDGLNFANLEAYNLAATATYDFGNATLTSVTGLWNANFKSRGDIDGGFSAAFAPPSGPGFIPFPAQTQDNVPDLDQFTQEIRLASQDTQGFGYQIGFFYFKETLDIESLSFPTPTSVDADIFATQRQRSRAFGLFGSFSYDITPQLKATLGARYNNDKRTLRAERTLGFLGPLVQTRSVDDEVLTYDASLAYSVNDDINLYARLARGYRAPSIQGRILFGNDVSTAQSEKILSYEAGVKSTLLDGRARFNLAFFYYDLKDQQLTAVGGGGNFNRLVNADKTTGYGFEADIEFKPVPALLLTAGVSLNDTEIKDPNLSIQPCGAPCTVLDPAGRAMGTVSINGNPLPQAPRFIANATARYGYTLGAGELFIFADAAYRSKINFFLYESVEFSDDRLFELGLRLGYADEARGFEVTAFARNLTNDTSAVSGIDFNNLTAMLNEPRTFGIEASFKF
jgi:iron complex outermembrane recepter protein